ncbi:hypothetical protein ACFSHR_17535 [Azotobacter chroococcum]
MTRLLKRLRPLFAALLLPAALAAHADDASLPKKLTIGLLPGESAPTVMRLNEPLRAHRKRPSACPSN